MILMILTMIYSGIYTADLPKTEVDYEAVVRLRESLVQRWYSVYNLVNLSCDNIQNRKFRDSDWWSGMGLNIHLMPLPNLLVAFPPLR